MSTQQPRDLDGEVDWAFDSFQNPDSITLFTAIQDTAVGSQTEWITADVTTAVDLTEAR